MISRKSLAEISFDQACAALRERICWPEWNDEIGRRKISPLISEETEAVGPTIG